MAEVAVVILNFNGQKFLEQFLPGVIKYSADTQVYVVDNCSTDDSLSILSNKFPTVNTIVTPKNLGYAGGYNFGLDQISADYYVLLNSDVEVTPSWIEPIVTFMDADPEVAACQPKILDYHNRSKFEYAGAAGGHLDLLGYPFCKGRIFDTLENDEGQYDGNHLVFWASGACLFIRSSVFHEVGGFDASFFAHMEEIDLCWRINLLQKKVYCITDSRVYHVGGGTLSKSSSKKTYLNFHNSLAMLYKYSPASSLLWKFPIRLVLDFVAGLKFWKDNSFGHFAAVLSAYFNFLKSIATHNQNRSTFKGIRSNKPTVGLSKLILPFRYYLRKQKSYDELT